MVVLNEGKQGGQGRGGKWTAENVVRFSITSWEPEYRSPAVEANSLEEK